MLYRLGKLYGKNTEGGKDMTIIIHDLDEGTEALFDFGDALVIRDRGDIKSCIGCFG